MARRKPRKEREMGSEEPYSEASGTPESGNRSTGASLAALKFASDPDYIDIFDGTNLSDFSIICPMSSARAFRNGSGPQTSYQDMNRPIVFNSAIQTHTAVAAGTEQLTISDPTLAGQVIFNELNRVYTTPGDIPASELETAVTDYVAHACNLIGGWAITAGLYGLAEAFPQATGQLRNYLSLIGAKTWQVEGKSAALKTLPLPPNLVNYLKEWYSIKQIPDGRAVFALPAQPQGLTPDEVYTGLNPDARSGLDLQVFETEFSTLQALTDSTGALIYPEMRRMLMKAGWKMFDFPDKIPVIRSGDWWDEQVVNVPFIARKNRDASSVAQANPQAGANRRAYALCVYGSTPSPALERLLTPIYSANLAAGWDRAVGAYDIGTLSSSQFSVVSLGRHNLSYNFEGITRHALTSALSLGQVQGVTGRGWSMSIGTSAASLTTEWDTGEMLLGLFSEIANILLADEGSLAAAPMDFYEKIYLGESTTVSSNRLKFGNTVSPNMFPTTATMGGVNTGNPSSMQRVYEYFLKPTG
jgi:hypothetical protein